MQNLGFKFEFDDIENLEQNNRDWQNLLLMLQKRNYDISNKNESVAKQQKIIQLKKYFENSAFELETWKQLANKLKNKDFKKNEIKAISSSSNSESDEILDLDEKKSLEINCIGDFDFQELKQVKFSKSK